MNVPEEQRKLTATYLNGLAIAIFAVGGLAPLFSSVYAGAPTPVPGWIIGLVSVSCFAGSAALHFLARRYLKGPTP